MSMCLDMARVLSVLSVVLFWACNCLGAPADDIRAALNENFAAYNAEDAKWLTATLAPNQPGLAEFKREAEKLFAEADSYISIKEFELLAVQGSRAKARVVQHTTTGDGTSTAYRQHTMLMPKYPTVEYVQHFNRVRGKWKVGLVEEEPREVKEPTQNISQGSQPAGRSVFGNCANGTCPQR